MHTMMAIHADELQPGDVIGYRGEAHRVIRVDRRDGWAWPIATDGTGWAIALDHHLVEVQRVPDASECRTARPFPPDVASTARWPATSG